MAIPGGSTRPVLAAMTVLTVAAAACAGWFGFAWLSAAHSATLADARTRDTVLQQAEQAVLNVNTMNYHHAAAGLKVWLASSTGDLHAQLAQNLSQEVTLVQQHKTITAAKILDGAVTELSPEAGTATVLVAVQVTVTPAAGSPYTESEREVGSLARTVSGWKLSSLGYAPSTPGASGSSSVPGASPTPGASSSPAPAPSSPAPSS